MVKSPQHFLCSHCTATPAPEGICMSNLPLSIFHFKIVVLLHTGRSEGADQISFREPFQPELFYSYVELCVGFHT